MKKTRGKVTENLIFSQLSYLTIFIILVCITERKKLKEDPLNFNVLNIVLEVIRLDFYYSFCFFNINVHFYKINIFKLLNTYIIFISYMNTYSK